MSSSRPTHTTSDTTQPSEIPTAIMEERIMEEESFFGDDETEDKTLDVTMSESSDGVSRDLQKFRRPTKSEIMSAVDQVNTESIDVLEVVQARAAQGETEDVGADDDD